MSPTEAYLTVMLGGLGIVAVELYYAYCWITGERLK